MYIWELPDWPQFKWDAAPLAEQLNKVVYEQGRLLGRMEGLGFRFRDEARLEVFTQDVVKSSAIEGVKLDGDTVRSSIARKLGLDIGALKPIDRGVEGVVEMILDATMNYAVPLSTERLFEWHRSLFPTGCSGMVRIQTGAWRPSESGPMQVVSGAIGKEVVQFEAPPAECIDHEMQRFLQWFLKWFLQSYESSESGEFGGFASFGSGIIRAGVAHLWFVTIHPFEDGNGRIGRAILDMALARSENNPHRFYSLSKQIEKEKKEYYRILEQTQKASLDITAYLVWYLGCLFRALEAASDLLSSVLSKARFWERIAGESLNERQIVMINRLLDGFEGKLTSSKWAKIAKCSQDTAYRDITDLMERSILVKNPGGGRSTSYSLVGE